MTRSASRASPLRLRLLRLLLLRACVRGCLHTQRAPAHLCTWHRHTLTPAHTHLRAHACPCLPPLRASSSSPACLTSPISCLPGAVLTKLDGDSRGGAALSVREVSGRPIKFVGTGEKMEALEPFYPER